MAFISIISPVFNTESSLQNLVERITLTVSPINENFEIILVDDRSPDSSWEVINALGQKHPFVKGLRLSRNFGQHAAIAAGLKMSLGEWVVVLDSDLQDLPEEIARLYSEAQKGYDIVLAKRASRTDSFYRKMGSRLFYLLLSRLSGLPSDSMVANFGIYNRKVIKNIIEMHEVPQYFPMMINWAGFKKNSIECEHGQRLKGKSGYNFKKLIRLALDITLSYSDKPLRYLVKLGFIISSATFVYGLVTFFRYLAGNITVIGYTSLILSIWFLGGIILFTLGVVGLYIGKIFEQVKGRPLFIISEQINCSHEN